MRFAAIFSILLVITLTVNISHVNGAIRNGALSENDIEWCEEVYIQYKAAGLDWFLENYHYSIEARVCANLYEDSIWGYQGDDRMQKLVERSKYYVELEIQESQAEAKSGKIDVKPAAMPEKFTSTEKMSSDGTVLVTIETTAVIAGENMGINVIFKDPAKKIIEHVNYDLRVIQDNGEVLVIKGQHSQTGMVQHQTRPLLSDKPVYVEVTILGIGLPADRTTWTGPSGDVITFSAVPEFGSLVYGVLTASMAALLALSAKLRLISRL